MKEASLLAAVLLSPLATSAQVQTVTLRDPLLNNMPAVTLQIPAGWRFAGSMLHPLCGNGNSYPQYRAESADGSMVIQVRSPFFIGSQGAFGDSDPRDCGLVGQPQPAVAVVSRYLFPELGKGLHGTPPVVDPKMDAAFQGAAGQQGNITITVNTAIEEFDYTSPSGAPMRGAVLAVQKQMEYGGNGFSSETTPYIMASVKGKEQQVFSALNSTHVAVLPAYQARQNEFYRKVGEEQKAAGERHLEAIRQQGREQVAAINAQGAAQMAAIKQQGAERMALIQADMQQHMQQSQAFAQQTIDSIHATGAASMAAAQATSQASHDSAMGTAAQMNNQTAIYGWCRAGAPTQYTTSMVNPGGYTRCE